MYEYRANILEVYDGDTVTALVDLGFHTQMTIKVRLVGINAPELKGDDKGAGLKSRDRLAELVLNKSVTLKTYKDKREKYGRWLAEIFLLDQAISINKQLINEGLAVPYEG